MILKSQTKSLQIVLAGDRVTSDCPWTMSAASSSPLATTGLQSNGFTAGREAVQVLGPTSSRDEWRIVKFFTLVNKDSSEITATLNLNDAGTLYPLFTYTLQPGDNLTYSDGRVEVSPQAAAISGDTSTGDGQIPDATTNTRGLMTTQQVAALAAKANTSDVTTSLAAKADASALAAKADASALAAKADASAMTAALAAKADASALAGKADASALAAKANASDVTTALAAKADASALSNKVDTSRTVAGHALTSDVTVSKADVGLGNADNTSDVNKPVSTAQATALATKADATATTAALATKADATATASALAGKANVSDVAADLAAKADLVSGLVPYAQLPLVTPSAKGVMSPAQNAALARFMAGLPLQQAAGFQALKAIATSFSAWTAHNAGASAINLSYTGDHYGSGADCAQVSTGGNCGTGSTNQCYLEITNIATPIDGTQGALVLAVKIPSYATLRNNTGIQLTACSDNSGTSNSYSWYWADPNGASTSRWATPDGTWLLLPFSFSFATVNGAPIISQLRTFRIRLLDTSDSVTLQAPAVAYFGFLGVAQTSGIVEGAPNGVITISLDDGRASQYALLKSVLKSRGIRATMHLIYDRLGATSSYMTVAQVNELAALGWDASLHAYTDADHASTFPTLGQAATLADIQAQIAAHAALGWDTRHAAFPSGSFDGGTLAAMASAGVASARTIYGIINSVPNPAQTFPVVDSASLLKLFAWSWLYTDPLATAKAYADKVKAWKAWGIVTMHDFIQSATLGSSQLNVADVSAFLDYALSIGITFRTESDMIP